MWPNSITWRGHTRLCAALWWISPRMENPWHLWTACSNVSLCSSCTFFCNISSVFLLLQHVSVDSHPSAGNLWEESGSIFSADSHLMAAESKQLPSELCPGWTSPVQPLLVCQVFSCPWPHCWLLTGLPACLSCTLGSPNQTHNSRYFPQAE